MDREASINLMDVFLYYKLTNFYQNHRRYVKSRDDNQLAGKLAPKDTPSDDCNPFRDIDGVPIAPCGAVANSLFNDTLKLYRCLKDDDDCKARQPVPVVRTGIAWPTDKSTKFQNPSGTPLKDAFNGSVKPPFWSKNIWQLDEDDGKGNIRSDIEAILISNGRTNERTDGLMYEYDH